MDDVEVKIKDAKSPSFVLSVRFLVAILVFFATALQYAQRMNMSVAIVCMVNNTAILLDYNAQTSSNMFNANWINSTVVDQCPNSLKEGNHVEDGEFVWPKKVQGYILASYFYGYMAANIPGGYLSMRFGAKYVIFFSILFGSAFTLLTPLSARLHFGVLIVVRVAAGLSHGVLWPSIASKWAHWAVPQERSTLISFGGAGAQIGNVVALLSGGFLCETLGWPSIFYVLGIAGLVWCVLWFIFTSDSPSTHRFVSEKEKAYILHHTNVSTEKRSTPWKAMFTSPAVLALFFGHVCAQWGTYLFQTNIPTYMKEVFKFDIKSNGTLSAVPYLGFWLLTGLSGVIGDKLTKTKTDANRTKLEEKNKIDKRRKIVRMIFHGLGYLIPMAAVIGLAFVTCEYTSVGLALLIVGISFMGCQYGAGMIPNYNDLCGKYSGVALGVGNSLASIPGFLAPYFVGFVTQQQKQEEWRIVFLVTAGIYLAGAIVLFIFGDAKPESWAVSGSENDNEDEAVEAVPLNEKRLEKS